MGFIALAHSVITIMKLSCSLLKPLSQAREASGKHLGLSEDPFEVLQENWAYFLLSTYTGDLLLTSGFVL